LSIRDDLGTKFNLTGFQLHNAESTLSIIKIMGYIYKLYIYIYIIL